MTDIGYLDGALPWVAVLSSVSEPRLPRGASRPASPSPPVVPASAPVGDDRARALFDATYDFVWRSLRGLGVAPGSLDDGAQQVFCSWRSASSTPSSRAASEASSSPRVRRGLEPAAQRAAGANWATTSASTAWPPRAPIPRSWRARGKLARSYRPSWLECRRTSGSPSCCSSSKRWRSPRSLLPSGSRSERSAAPPPRPREISQDELERVRKTPPLRRGTMSELRRLSSCPTPATLRGRRSSGHGRRTDPARRRASERGQPSLPASASAFGSTAAAAGSKAGTHWLPARRSSGSWEGRLWVAAALA